MTNFKWQLLATSAIPHDAEGDAAAAAAAAAAAKPWYDGADTETVGYLENRGLNGKDAKTVAFEAIKSHREAEKLIGVPTNELLRLPKVASDEAGWKKVWTALGAPADGKYDFSTVKKADGTPADQSFLDDFTAAAAKLHLPKDAAVSLAQDVLKLQEKQGAATAAIATDNLNKERALLDKNWGKDKEANLFIAKAAVVKLGLDPEIINALEKTAGYAKTMDFLRDIGTRIGEDKFVSGGASGHRVMTKDQASEQLATLKADTAWTKRYMAGGADEGRQMAALMAIISAD
jgi:hypothetical protein